MFPSSLDCKVSATVGSLWDHNLDFLSNNLDFFDNNPDFSELGSSAMLPELGSLTIPAAHSPKLVLAAVEVDATQNLSVFAKYLILFHLFLRQ
jgi:hypothetical protein